MSHKFLCFISVKKLHKNYGQRCSLSITINNPNLFSRLKTN
uniref:Uncharacterized protein n=1 Tax=Rhizophora mucronata TaxID=61149 RepID=A0A2P2L2J4_RHIMU